MTWHGICIVKHPVKTKENNKNCRTKTDTLTYCTLPLSWKQKRVFFHSSQCRWWWWCWWWGREVHQPPAWNHPETQRFLLNNRNHHRKCCALPAIRHSHSHRRRIETEGKSKVVTSVWGAAFVQFLATLAVLPRSIRKKLLNSAGLIGKNCWIQSLL